MSSGIADPSVCARGAVIQHQRREQTELFIWSVGVSQR